LSTSVYRMLLPSMAAPPIPPLQPPPLSPLRSQRHDLMHHIGPPSVAASQLRCRVTVAVVASAPLLFLLAIVIGLCCRRICAPQDALYSVGTVDLVNVLRKARAADVRVRLTLSSVAVVIAWAIFVLVNDVSMLKCDEWLIPAPVRGWLNQVPLLVLLALRPVDRAGIRITATFFTMLALFYAFMDYTFLRNHWIPEAEAAHWTPAATAAVCFQAFNIPRWAVFVPGCLSVVLLCRTSTRGALRRLWCLQLAQRVVGALIAFPQATSSLLAGEPVPDFLRGNCWAALIGVCATSAAFLFRGRIQRGAMTMVLPSDSKGLVAVAALMRSGLSTSTFDRRCLEAIHMFRSLPWSALRMEHLDSAQSSEEECRHLAAASRPATFGEVDAFISHSWGDDGLSKFRALQSWAREFEAANGREPRIWFDKACIDQNDIERSLLGLPIFVTGCSSFVILAGPKYVSRLWCML